LGDDREELYIIDSASGQTLFFNSFSTLDHDAELFAGLLTAILQFAKSYSKYQIGGFSMAKNEICMLRSKQYTLLYVYILDKNLIKKKNKIDIVAKRLKDLSDSFEKKFTRHQIQQWNGDVNLFKPFSQHLTSIVNASRFSRFR
jgi:hypothetical protein